jgi:hypothetical protein
MILKLREAKLARLTANESPSRDVEIEELNEEIRYLREQLQHHPQVVSFAIENLELRGNLM